MRTREHLKSLALPLLAITYPVLFLYAHNAWILQLNNLKIPLLSALLVATGGYGLFYLFQRSPVKASLSMLVFVLFYYLYGLIYQFLLKQDRFLVEHYILLPLVIALAVYAGLLISQVRPAISAVVQKSLLVGSAGLFVLNALMILPVEIQKAKPARALIPVTSAKAAVPTTKAGQKPPDIYYIIFDEYVRFDAMRQYWHNDDVDAFDAFLKQHHFFVASQSITPTINTTSEMASRLNLHQYNEKDNPDMLQKLIDNNKVMQILKSHGYTTVSVNMFYPNIQADINYKINTGEVGGLPADEFEQTFFENTMLSAFRNLIQGGDQAAARQRDLIEYTFNQTVNSTKIKGPKFVYTHFLLPHTPFIFDQDGHLLPPQAAEDWHYYLGQYQYTTKLAMQLISKILANADPSNPPVIIVQSDEGARNLQNRTKDNIVMNGYLENYPGRYNQYILNALYLPGYDYSQLSAALPPIQTFPIVLNHYLDAGVSVDKSP